MTEPRRIAIVGGGIAGLALALGLYRHGIAATIYEAAPEIAVRYAIRGIPTLIVFQRGREVARQSGAMDARSIVSWLGSIANTARATA